MIDREKIIKSYEDFVNGYECFCTSDDYEYEMHKAVLALLKEQEEKPLRCDKCRYHREDGWCGMLGQWVKETDYCSLGAWKGQ